MLNRYRATPSLVLCVAALAIRAEAATPKIFSTVVNSSINQRLKSCPVIVIPPASPDRGRRHFPRRREFVQ